MCPLQPESALSGLAWVDLYRLFYPETLHQDHQGVGKRLIDKLGGLLSDAEFERVNQQLLQTDAFPGQAMHKQGLLGITITAHVANCMLQRLGPAVLALAVRGSLPEPLDHWLQALTRVRRPQWDWGHYFACCFAQNVTSTCRL